MIMSEELTSKEAALFRRYMNGGLSMRESLDLILIDRETAWEEPSDAS